jgi:hypothetical protein
MIALHHPYSAPRCASQPSDRETRPSSSRQPSRSVIAGRAGVIKIAPRAQFDAPQLGSPGRARRPRRAPCVGQVLDPQDTGDPYLAAALPPLPPPLPQPHRARGSTWSSVGSPCSPDECCTAPRTRPSMPSRLTSTAGGRSGTATPARSCGTRPPTSSSEPSADICDETSEAGHTGTTNSGTRDGTNHQSCEAPRATLAARTSKALPDRVVEYLSFTRSPSSGGLSQTRSLAHCLCAG